MLHLLTHMWPLVRWLLHLLHVECMLDGPLLAMSGGQSHDNGSRELPRAALCRDMPAPGVLETLLIWTYSDRSSASDSGMRYHGLLSMIHLPRLLSARAKRLDSCLLERY